MTLAGRTEDRNSQGDGTRATGSPGRTKPGVNTRAYSRPRPGWIFADKREKSPSMKDPAMFLQGWAGLVISSSTSPTLTRAPGPRLVQSRPQTVRFSPVVPRSMGCPSDRNSSICSWANRHTARSGPPWKRRSRWRSPLSPEVVTSTGPATCRLGTPPFEIWMETRRPAPGVSAGERGLWSADMGKRKITRSELTAVASRIHTVGRLAGPVQPPQAFPGLVEDAQAGRHLWRIHV